MKVLKEINNSRMSLTVTKIEQEEEIISVRALGVGEDINNLLGINKPIEDNYNQINTPFEQNYKKTSGGFTINVVRKLR